MDELSRIYSTDEMKEYNYKICYEQFRNLINNKEKIGKLILLRTTNIQ